MVILKAKRRGTRRLRQVFRPRAGGRRCSAAPDYLDQYLQFLDGNVPMGATIEDEMHPLRSLLRVKSLPAGA